MKNVFGLVSLILIFMTACFYKQNIQFASDIVLSKIDDSTVTIAVYYYMGEEEFKKRLYKFEELNLRKKKSLYKLQTVVQIEAEKKEDLKVLAYIGSGTLLRDNHILSVKHLFNRTDNTVRRKIWIFHARGGVFEADLVAMSEGKEFCDDYAIIKVKEDLGYKGIRIVQAENAKRGDKVIVIGSPGKIAFFTRFTYLTTFKNFLRRNDEGNLALSYYDEFPYWCIYPGGPGDSGGSIRNIYGNLISILYCGIELYSEEYIFANPTKMLWDFLKKNNLEWLGQRDFSVSSFEKIEEEIVLQK